MDGYIIAQWTATILIALGLVYTIKVNSNNKQQTDTELTTESRVDIRVIKEKLEDPLEGLGAIRREISALKERVAGVEKDIREMKND